MSFSILFTFPRNSYPNLHPFFLISHCQALSSLGHIGHLTGLVVVCLCPLIIHPSAVPVFPVRMIYLLAWTPPVASPQHTVQAPTCFSACILCPCSCCGPHLSLTQLPTCAWTRFVSRAMLPLQPAVLCPSASGNDILISEDLSRTFLTCVYWLSVTLPWGLFIVCLPLLQIL